MHKFDMNLVISVSSNSKKPQAITPQIFVSYMYNRPPKAIFCIFRDGLSSDKQPT